MGMHSDHLGSEGFLNRSNYLSFGFHLGRVQNIPKDCSSRKDFYWDSHTSETENRLLGEVQMSSHLL